MTKIRLFGLQKVLAYRGSTSNFIQLSLTVAETLNNDLIITKKKHKERKLLFPLEMCKIFKYNFKLVVHKFNVVYFINLQDFVITRLIFYIFHIIRKSVHNITTT